MNNNALHETDTSSLSQTILQSHLFNMTYSDFMELCSNIYLQQQGPKRNEMISALTKIAASIEMSNRPKYDIIKDSRISRQDYIYIMFVELVYQNYIMQRSINFYADKLCLTPKYLSTVVKNCSGKTPHEWINERVIERAQILLKTTNMSVQQISDELNFSNQSFFGKYFKRHVGKSPKGYIEYICQNKI